MANPKPRNPDGNPATEIATAFGEAVANRISLICKYRHFKFSDVEQQIGKAKGSVSGIVSGRRGGAITGVMLTAIADALDVDVGWLMTGRGSVHALSRKGFTLCGVSPSSRLWPPVQLLLAEPLVSGTPPQPRSRKKKPRR